MRYFFLIILLLLPVISRAQFTAPGNSAVSFTSYPSAPTVKDPIFIYCNASGSQKATLVAKSPHGNAPFNYTWYQWSDATKSFSTLLKTETGVVTSTSSNLNEGGYKVVISGGFDTTLVSWISIDKPVSSAELQNATCDYVALKGQAAEDAFFYRDIAGGTPVKLVNNVKFLWSSDPVSVIPSPDFYLTPQIFDPPFEDETYNLLVTDSYGCTSSSSFFYPSIRVKADFTAEPVTGQAPLVVTLTDKSIRAITYKWEFGDSLASVGKIKQIFSSVSPDPDPHTYYFPGDYTLVLTVTGKCVDSTKIKISVDKSSLYIPNVFTPNGDGLNDKFLIESKSLRILSVEIFSRSGRNVYSYLGEDDGMKDWTGWDGNVNSSSVKAAPGIYFYIINARGWDDLEYKGKEYRGFVYLYR